jgi:hypothetical protein
VWPGYSFFEQQSCPVDVCVLNPQVVARSIIAVACLTTFQSRIAYRR